MRNRRRRSRPSSRAVAPAPGRILFAGPFRDYGGVVIIDHGNGWTSSVTGLGGTSVRVGEHVAQGARIGRAPGGDAPRITVELRRRGEPMDLARLLGAFGGIGRGELPGDDVTDHADSFPAASSADRNRPASSRQ